MAGTDEVLGALLMMVAVVGAAVAEGVVKGAGVAAVGAAVGAVVALADAAVGVMMVEEVVATGEETMVVGAVGTTNCNGSSSPERIIGSETMLLIGTSLAFFPHRTNFFVDFPAKDLLG